MRLLAPDEALDVIQQAPGEEREGLLSLLDDKTRREVKGLMDYAEEEAGGLINQRYARLRPHMTVDEAVSFLRRDARDRAQTIYYAYVTDSEERLLGCSHFQGFANNARRQEGRGRYAHRRDHSPGAFGSSSA